MKKKTEPIDPRFKEVVFVIEATGFEKLCLWEKHHTETKWEEDLKGLWVQVGKVGKHLVYIDVSFAKIFGQQVVFYEPTSQVVDYNLIEEWIMKQSGHPTWDNSRRAHCDAMNFHLCLDACRELLK